MAELIGDKPTPFGASNPHPGFGKDENIANEFGHTEYPKYVHTFDEKGKITDSKLVANADEEAEAEGYTVAWVKPKAVKAEKGKAPAKEAWPTKA